MSRLAKRILILIMILVAMSLILTGCGGSQQKPQQMQAVQVKAMPVLVADAPLSYEYSGQVIGKGEVKVQSRISGRITEKYIHGGQAVSEGQALFRVDSRQYEAAVLQAQANLSKSKTTLSNYKLDLERYQKLLASGAVPEQTVTNQRSMVRAQESDVEAMTAMLMKAQDDLKDTVVYAPIAGRAGIDDLAIGTYVNAGNTNLVTISSNDPIFVQFSISEMEYLRFMNARQNSNRNRGQRIRISLTLADGTNYPYYGQFGEAGNTLADNTGTLILRTIFDNPENLLVPGMFAKVTISGLTIPNSVLVPERALQQLLGESFVLVVNAENKSEIRTVKLGEKIGSYYVVTDGLKANDLVVVEGLSKLRENMPVEVTTVTAEDMGFSLRENSELFSTDK